jgi:hypothetical protein
MWYSGYFWEGYWWDSDFWGGVELSFAQTIKLRF